MMREEMKSQYVNLIEAAQKRNRQRLAKSYLFVHNRLYMAGVIIKSREVIHRNSSKLTRKQIIFS